MSVEIIRAGALTTVQDLGRYGMQRFGVPVGGAMDAYSLRIANALVGNAHDAAALEMTLTGPVLQFGGDTLVALAGGDLGAMIGDKPMPLHRPVWVAGGRRIAFGPRASGARAYLAFAGGIDVPPVLGSRCTYLRAGLGGFDGRALRAGDSLDLLASGERYLSQLRDSATFARDGFAAPNWSAMVDAHRMMVSPQRIRFVAGRHWPELTPDARSAFETQNFRVGAASDRMGYRLAGVALEGVGRGDIASEAVTFGTIQLPPDGQPIVLMADRQTIGGYPRLGEVASADLPWLAQLQPGDALRFERVTLTEAQRLVHAQEIALAQMHDSIMTGLNGATA
jgi:antagonist of KipI